MNRRFLSLSALLLATTPFAALSAETTLLFGFDSARITQQHVPLIDAAVADFRANGSTSISVIGYTDTSGASDYNEALSQRRAAAVASALADRGVSPSSMVTAWRGQNDLLVETGDGVREPQNRRVTIDISQAPQPAPAAAAPAPAPVAVAPARDRFRFIIAPFGAYNNQPDDESYFLGLNLTASYDLTPNIVISAEQAGFRTFDARDNGWGGRSAAGLDFQIDGLGGALPYVGGNVGYTYVDGSVTGGLFAGPEIGLRYEGFSVKIAYDYYIDDNGRGRGLEDGVLSATLGYGFRF